MSVPSLRFIQSRRRLPWAAALLSGIVLSAPAAGDGLSGTAAGSATGPVGSAAAGDAPVDPSGAFATSIPIRVPAFRDLEPGLALVYNSSAGNGIVGAGWSVGGLGSVARATPTGGRPRFDDSDAFFLGGQRLYPCSQDTLGTSSGCANAGEFFTEVEAGTRIRRASDGGWVVETKDGTRREYHFGVTSRNAGVLRWLLTSVWDSAGNFVAYEYEQDRDASGAYAGEAYPIRITYGAFGAYAIRFLYDDRPDVGSVGVGDGTLVDQVKRLRGIDETLNGGRIRFYQLDYQTSPVTRRSLLTSVQEFGTDATVSGVLVTNRDTATSRPPVVLTYASISGGFPPSAIGSTVSSASKSPPSWGDQLDLDQDFAIDPVPKLNRLGHIAVDFNGDGLADHITYSPYTAYAYLAQIDGSYVKLPTIGYSYTSATTAADITGDGVPELIAYSSKGLLIFTFDSKPTDKEPLGHFRPLSSNAKADVEYAAYMFGDVDGDGLADLVNVSDYPRDGGFPSWPAKINVAIGRGDGNFDGGVTSPNAYSSATIGEGGAYATLMADMNGDGRMDILRVVGGDVGGKPVSPHGICTAVARTANKLAFATDPFRNECFTLASDEVEGTWVAADVNGDGKSDLVRVRSGAGGSAVAYVSTGYPNSWTRSPIAALDTSMTFPKGVLAADLNGDGRADFGWADGGCDEDSGQCATPVVRAFKSYGVPGTAQATFTSDPYNYLLGIRWRDRVPMTDQLYFDLAASSIDLADADGDGAADIVTWDANSTWVTVAAVCDPAIPSNIADDPRCRAYCGPDLSDKEWDRRGCRNYVDVTYTFNPKVSYSGRGDARASSSGTGDVAPVRVQTADVNGDGRPDTIQVRHVRGADDAFALHIDTKLNLGSGLTWQERGQTIPISGNDARVAALLKPVDIDADGRIDLAAAVPAPDGASVTFVALRSMGDGSWQLQKRSQATTVKSERLRNWHMLDANADGRADFVYVYIGADASLMVAAYLAKPDGSFTAATPYRAGTAETDLVNRNGVGWITGDVNRDGKSDLLFVGGLYFPGEPTGLERVVSVLVADESGKYALRRTVVHGDLNSAPEMWRVADLNGDGLIDLANLAADYEGQGYSTYIYKYLLTIDALLSLGDGTVSRQTLLDAERVGAPEQTQWLLSDLDGDGVSDLLYLWFFQDGTKPKGKVAVSRYTLQTRKSGAGYTSAFVFDSAPSIPNALTFPLFTGVSADVYAEGDGTMSLQFSIPSLSAVPRDYGTNEDKRSLEIARLRWQMPQDIVAAVRNPAGANTSITYRSALYASHLNQPSFLTGPSCQLPPGNPGLLVQSTTQSPNTGDASYTVSFGFQCPVWLPKERQFLGWKRTNSSESPIANRTARITERDFDMTLPACGARVSSTSNAVSGSSASTQRTATFVASPIQPPYLCEVEQSTQRETDQKGARRGVGARFVYDAFRNISWSIDDGDLSVSGDERSTRSTFDTWTTPYVQLLRKQEVFPGTTAGKAVAMTQYEYGDARGLMTKMREQRLYNGTDEGERVTTISYDEYGNIKTIDDPKGNKRTMQYDSALNLFSIVTKDPLGQSLSADWDARFALPKKLVNPNGGWTQMTFDALGRTIRIDDSQGGAERTTYTQWTSGGIAHDSVLREIANPDGTWQKALTTFDGFGRPRLVQSDVAGTSVNTYSDNSPRVFKVLRTGVTKATEAYYDERGRVVRTVRSDGAAATTEYRVGSVVQLDENGHEIRSFVGPGWSTRVEEQHGRGWVTTERSYDVLGREIEVTDAKGNVTRRSWDSLGQLRLLEDPDVGSNSFGYDVVGNLATLVDAHGILTSTTFDELNRPKTTNWIDTKGKIKRTVTKTYDESGTYTRMDGTSAQSYGKARLTAVVDTDSSCAVAATFNYDRLAGQPTSITKCKDGITQTVELDYDKRQRLAKLIYPDGEQLRYGYNSAGQLAEVLAKDWSATLKYNPRGRMSDLTIGAPGALVDEHYEYDPDRDWIDSIDVNNGMELLYQANYGYKPDGFLDSATESGVITSARTFEYDGQHRLTSVKVGAKVTEGFEYDELGNMAVGPLGRYEYPATGAARVHAALGVKTTAGGDYVFSYDEYGNLVKEEKGGKLQRSFEWNEQNRLSGVTVAKPLGKDETTTFAYDADGRLIKTTKPDGSLLYTFFPMTDCTPPAKPPMGKPPLCSDAATGLTKAYFAGSRLIARRDVTGAMTFAHVDRLGSTVLLTDLAGDVVPRGTYEYSAFGTKQGPAPASLFDFLYTGERQLVSTQVSDGNGLVNLRARFYDPLTARFISPDTDITGPGTMGLNRFAYVAQNPLAYVDPFGHEECGDAGCLQDGSEDADPQPYTPQQTEIANLAAGRDPITGDMMYWDASPMEKTVIVEKAPPQTSFSDGELGNFYSNVCPMCLPLGITPDQRDLYGPSSGLGLAGWVAQFLVPMAIGGASNAAKSAPPILNGAQQALGSVGRTGIAGLPPRLKQLYMNLVLDRAVLLPAGESLTESEIRQIMAATGYELAGLENAAEGMWVIVLGGPRGVSGLVDFANFGFSLMWHTHPEETLLLGAGRDLARLRASPQDYNVLRYFRNAVGQPASIIIPENAPVFIFH